MLVIFNGTLHLYEDRQYFEGADSQLDQVSMSPMSACLEVFKS